MSYRALLGLILAGAVSSQARLGAAGHGPVFGLTTPTNAAGAWSFDFGVMVRKGAAEDGVMARAMLAYGVTEDFQLAVSVPAVLSTATLVPARVTGMMAGTGDVEGLAAWRFHRQATGIGARVESTAYVGIVTPGSQRPAGLPGELNRAVGVYTAVATGVASRSHYVWGGVGYTRFAEAGGDRRPDLLAYSAVWGFRPPAWRTDYPDWDWRLFAELTGERTGHIRRRKMDVAGTGGHQVFLGPTALGIYKNYAIEGGIQFPVYRDVGSRHQDERFRMAVNFSYFF